MKIAGIILLVLGGLSVIGGIIGAMAGRPNFSGLAFVALGGFLLYRANQKKEEEEAKKRWEDNSSEN